MSQKNDALNDLLANPFGEVVEENEAVKITKSEEQPQRLIDVLPEENRQRAIQLAEQIDPTDFQAMMMYGTQAQSKLMSFSHAMLDQVQKKDIGEVGVIPVSYTHLTLPTKSLV